MSRNARVKLSSLSFGKWQCFGFDALPQKIQQFRSFPRQKERLFVPLN
jgi:hypothetical protein